MHEDGFGLIVRGMSNGDACGFSFFNQATKEIVSKAPSGVFHIPLVALGNSGHILAIEEQFDIVRAAKLGDELGVSGGLDPSQRVVEMRRKKRDPERIAQL